METPAPAPGSAASRGGPIRVALLGAGGIAEAHVLSLRAVPGAQVVGVADVDEARAAAFRSRWQIQASFGSLARMLAATQPDVVHILLPPDLHAEHALTCLAAGAHVFVEKPLCTSEEECVALEAAAEQCQRRVGVNHNVTFDACFGQLVAAIHARRLGAIRHVAVVWNVPFVRPELRGRSHRSGKNAGAGSGCARPRPASAFTTSYRPRATSHARQMQP